MSRKVCHISTVHYENDSRILLKECQSLSKAGFDVSLIINSDKDKYIYGTNIIALDNTNKSRFYRMFKKSKIAFNKALEADAEIYHFHDPELISLGKKLKRRGKKVIYDVHEDVPKQILSKTYLGPLFLRKIISKVFSFYEKTSSKSFDAVIGAIDEISCQFNNKNAVTIKNYAIKDLIEAAVPVKREDNDKIVLIYVGSITRIRGIKELIKATELLQGKAELWILGKFETEELQKECEAMEGYKYSKYFGSLPLKDVYSYIKAADIGICTLHPTENYKESIPIKVLEYMASEVPIILSDFKYWKNLFGEVGIYVDPLDPKSTAKAVEHFLENREKVKEIGTKNKERFLKEFSWDAEEKKLIELYNRI
ncbi:glycosyltransferase [Streptococcus sp.]|uniref:glycosyltransferase n=1 Tax=Streptococcus sp. TaxID=1306 RepID=UPI001842CD14|nr:glycosyltransferase [Streptococcus sp.]HHU66215.1 glycosyltransferase family 4 protein [Streptococcus sp.]